MSRTHKSSGAAAGVGADIDQVAAEYAKGVAAGVKELTELKGQSVDLAARYSRDLVESWKKGADLAVSAFQQSAAAHKKVLELAGARGNAAAQLAAVHADSFAKLAGAATSAFDALAGLALSTQKEAFDLIAMQQNAASDAAERQLTSSSRAAVETFQRAVDTLVETQRNVREARDAA